MVFFLFLAFASPATDCMFAIISACCGAFSFLTRYGSIFTTVSWQRVFLMARRCCCCGRHAAFICSGVAVAAAWVTRISLPPSSCFSDWGGLFLLRYLGYFRFEFYQGFLLTNGGQEKYPYG